MRKPLSQPRFTGGLEEDEAVPQQVPSRRADAQRGTTLMDDVAFPISSGGSRGERFAGESFMLAERRRAGARTGPDRRRATIREMDRLTDALRVARAVLRRVAAGGHDAADLEAVRSGIEAADAALGGKT